MNILISQTSASNDCPADVVLVIDKSGSMIGHFDKVLDFVRNIVSGFQHVSDDQTRVGIIVFNGSASTEVCENNCNFST